MTITRVSLVMTALILLFTSVLRAQNGENKEGNKPIPEAEVSTTKNTIKINGQSVSYTTTAGTLLLRDENDKPVALHGFTAYTRDGVSDTRTRPITFAYNGGPGSSSIWLHMGALGPKRAVVNDPDFTPAAPYRLEENPFSIIDVTDVVMMDPVGTGLSQPVGDAEGKDFWGVEQDIKAISLFIRQYITENQRWNSPKYLLGESYGTMRNAGVMNYLQQRMGMAMNGVIMVSAVFDLRTLTFQDGDDISYIVNLPTYAAVAWYHNKIPDKTDDLETFIEKAREFASGPYSAALMKGDRISETEMKDIAGQLSALTGLSEKYLIQSNLRVTEPEFAQELLREDGQTVGRLDGRFIGINQDLLTQRAQYDPQSAAISPGYTAAFMEYYYNELGVNRQHTYHTSAYAREGFNWDWTRGRRGWPTGVNTGPDMAEAMTRDPNVKVLVINGIYDLATPFYGVEYSIDHLELEPEIKDNIIMTYFEAGHMMYTHQPSLEKFKKVIADFIAQTEMSGTLQERR